jgi:hypothetical protein
VIKLRINTEIIAGLRVSDPLRGPPVIVTTNNGQIVVTNTVGALPDDIVYSALAYSYGHAAQTVPLASQAWSEIDEAESSSYYSGLMTKYAAGNTVALEITKEFDFGYRLILIPFATATPNLPVLGSTTLTVIGGGSGVNVDNEVTLRVKALSTTAQDFAGATLSIEGEVAGLTITPATAVSDGSGEATFVARGVTPSAHSLVGRGVDGVTTVNSAVTSFYVYNGIGGSSEVLQPVGISPTSFTVPENSTAIGTINSPLIGAVYSITGGPDAALFSIGSSSGVITAISPLDYESDPSLSFNVAATNGSSTDVGTVTVAVTNVIETYEIDAPNSVGIDAGGVGSVAGAVLGEGVPVPGATLTGSTTSPCVEVIAAPGGGGTTFLVSTSLDVAFPGMVTLHYGLVQKDIQIVDLITGTITANLSAISSIVGQAISIVVTVYSDNGITPHAAQSVSARWANTALAAIGGWSSQTTNGSGQATFTFTPTIEGDSIIVLNAGARAIAIPVSASQISGISLYPPSVTILPGGSKGYNVAALDASGSEIVGAVIGVAPVSSAPISGVGGNPGVVTANVVATPGAYKLRFTVGSVTRDLDVSVRSSASSFTSDVNTGLANQLEIKRKQTAMAVLFDLEELLTTNPRTGAAPSISLSMNGRSPVSAVGDVSEIGAGRYVWSPASEDVNEDGSLIMLISESNSKPVTPIVIGVVTPYGAR